MEKTKKQKGSIGNTKVQADKNQMELSLQVKESDKLAQSLQADSFVQAIDFVQSMKPNSTPKIKSSVKTTQSKQNTNLSKREKESKLKTLSLEGVQTEKNALKSAPFNERSPKEELFFDNLITVEELAVVFRLAPQTIRLDSSWEASLCQNRQKEYVSHRELAGVVKPKGEITMAIIKRQYKTKKQKKPIIYYQAEVFIKGARIAVKNFSVKRSAILWHEEQRHKFTSSPTSLNDRMLFKDCLDRFWESAETRMMKSTLQAYETRLSYFYKSPLAEVKMSELKGIKIVEWISWLKKHKTAKNKGRHSFKHELKFLSVVLNWYRNFINEDFNAPITKKHRQMCFFKPNAPRRPDYFIEPKDAKTWVEWLKENRSNPVYWRLASFMLLTGARVGEACGLKWSAVNLEKGFVRIVRRVRWDQRTKHPFLEDTTKTSESTRVLMLPEKLKNILRDMKKSALNDLVFTDLKGGILKYNAIQSSFNAGFIALKLPWRSTHICRHTYATIALMATKNLSAVQASLGHTEIKMTQRYAKTVALLSSETGEKTASLIFKDDQLFRGE